MQLGSIDLNLLLSLQALLEEGSVTRAAERVLVSQPTMSTNLARLRRHFDDDLLVRDGNRSRLTQLAEDLRPRVAVAVDAFADVFGDRLDFVPRDSVRVFRVAASDYAITIMGDELLRIINASGEGIRVEFTPLTTAAAERPREFLQSHDAMVMPHGVLRDVPHLDLFDDQWLCLVDEHNTVVGDVLSMDDLAALPWIMTYHYAAMPTLGARVLQMHGIEPHIRLGTDSFLAVPSLVAGTDSIALVQQRMVTTMGLPAGVRALTLPFEAPLMTLALWYHPAQEADPGHRWLREQFRRAASYLPDLDGPA